MALELHPEKTWLLRFGRFARRDCQRLDGESKPATFNFLGFTHYCGVNQSGKLIIGRVTQRKRMTPKLHEVKAALRERMHEPLKEQGKWLVSVIRGFCGYHAIPGKRKALGAFRTQCTRLWYKTLRRRNQKTRLNWNRVKKLAQTWLPPARIHNPGARTAVCRFCPR